jgi:ATP synthase protein I
MVQPGGNKRERMTLLRAMGVASACGLDLATGILVGVLVGLFADSRLHSAPWGLLVGLFIGLVAGFYTAYRIIAPLVRSL